MKHRSRKIESGAVYVKLILNVQNIPEIDQVRLSEDICIKLTEEEEVSSHWRVLATTSFR